MFSIAALAAGCAVEQDDAPERACDAGWARHGDYHSDTGFEELAGYVKLKGDLVIDGADVRQLEDIACLESIEGNLVIQNVAELEDLRGFGSLTDVWGRVTIASNPNLTTLAGLDQLWLAGELVIFENPSLRDVSGLSNVEALARLEIVDNDALVDLSGLAGVDRVGALVVWANDRLSVVEFPALRLVATDLRIAQNAGLFELSMPSLVTLGGELRVQWNPMLPTCLAENIAHRLTDGGYAGDVTIEGNNDDGMCLPAEIESNRWQ